MALDEFDDDDDDDDDDYDAAGDSVTDWWSNTWKWVKPSNKEEVQ